MASFPYCNGTGPVYVVSVNRWNNEALDPHCHVGSRLHYSVNGWRHLVKATEVTAGLAESNGSLPPGD